MGIIFLELMEIHFESCSNVFYFQTRPKWFCVIESGLQANNAAAAHRSKQWFITDNGCGKLRPAPKCPRPNVSHHSSSRSSLPSSSRLELRRRRQSVITLDRFSARSFTRSTFHFTNGSTLLERTCTHWYINITISTTRILPRDVWLIWTLKYYTYIFGG